MGTFVAVFGCFNTLKREKGEVLRAGNLPSIRQSLDANIKSRMALVFTAHRSISLLEAPTNGFR